MTTRRRTGRSHLLLFYLTCVWLALCANAKLKRVRSGDPGGYGNDGIGTLQVVSKKDLIMLIGLGHTAPSSISRRENGEFRQVIRFGSNRMGTGTPPNQDLASMCRRSLVEAIKIEDNV